MNKPIVLSCQDLAKTYLDSVTKVQVFADLNLQVEQGEIVAIVGTSGSGKSTLLHLLGGLDAPTAGQVTINGRNPYGMNEVERSAFRNQHLGFIYQFHHLLPEFTALENVAMPLLIRGVAPKQTEAAAQQSLKRVGLEHRLEHRIGQLSGGERQRVAIARALVTKPACILADEPTGNLDPANAERVLNLFFELQQEIGTSVVMVTHDYAIAKRAHRMLKIEAGRLEKIIAAN